MEDPQVTIGFNTQTVDLDDLRVPSRLRTHTHILSPHFPPLHRPHLLQPLQALRPVFEGAIQAADLRMGGIHAAVVLLDVVNPGTCGETCEEKNRVIPSS